MELPDLISREVWEKARIAFEKHENWVACNNTLLFLKEFDIQFFINREDAEDFSFDNHHEGEKWNVIRVNNLGDFTNKVEAVMPGLVYKPVQDMVMVQESSPSFFQRNFY